MDRVAAAELFARVVETGSFSKAAADLGMTQPTATKAVAAIEQRLGVRLLHRSTRGVTPTEVGKAYYDKCRQIRQAVEDAEQVAVQRQGAIGGQLRVSTSVAFGRRVLVPLVLQWMRRHPTVRVDLAFDDRYVDLVEQGVDLAIRMGQMADSSLGARYLAHNPWLMAATPQYLGRHGTPDTLDALARHACIVYSSVQGDDRWHLTPPGGQARSVVVRAALRANNLSAVLAAAVDGFGLAVLPRYVAHAPLATGRLVEVMADHGLPGQDVHAVYPSPRLVPSKVTAFIAHLQQGLSGDWWAGVSV